MGLKVVTGSRYLGGFVGDQKSETTWLAWKVQGWAESVQTISGVARKHQQSTYTGLQKSLQQEWEFVQRVTPYIGDAFRMVETSLWDVFLLYLLQGIGEGTPGRGITRPTVKHAGLDLPYPKKTAPDN